MSLSASPGRGVEARLCSTHDTRATHPARLCSHTTRVPRTQLATHDTRIELGIAPPRALRRGGNRATILCTHIHMAAGGANVGAARAGC